MNVTIDKWLDRVRKGISYKEDYGGAAAWPIYRDYARNNFTTTYLANLNPGDYLTYNLIYAMERALVPNVYFRNPYITVTANQPGRELNAYVVQAVDNFLIDALDIKRTFKMMVVDAYFTNRGICKIGYDGIYTSLSSSQEDIDTSNLLGIPLDELAKKKGSGRVSYATNIHPGMPWAQRCMPELIVVPFGTRSLEDCQWIDHIVYRNLEDVQEDRKYKNTSKLTGTHTEFLDRPSFRNMQKKDLFDQEDIVEIHEIHDFKHREVCAFTPGYEEWLREPSEDLLQKGGLPFVDFTFNDDGEYYWGASDARILEPQQLEINNTITQAMHHRRISLLKFLVERGAMSPEEAAKLLSPTVGPLVEVTGIPSQVITTLQPHIPPDLTGWVELVRSNARELIGFGRQQLGEAPSGRRTAEEMKVVQAGTDIRMDERRDIVADALVRTVRKLNSIVLERWTTDKVVQVVGYDGARYWVSYKGVDNIGDYTLRVDVESMTPRTKSVKKRELVELIQALGKNPRTNLDHLMRLLLREYEWVDAMKVLPEAPETLNAAIPQEKFMQLQNQMLNNSRLLQSRAMANSAGIGGGE